MNQRIKNGFSLVEVMIIFTVFAVVLAASMPMITKRTSLSPKKITHGVYRCIQTNDGLLEELYNGNSRIRGNIVDKCTFAVPDATMYKVDMYSAGSGGTLGVKVDAALDPLSENERTVIYGLGSILNGETGGAYKNNQLYTLSDADFRRLFNGKYVVDSIYTGDAGAGQSVHFKYESVRGSSCGLSNTELKSYSDSEKEKIEKVLGILKDHWQIIKETDGWGNYSASSSQDNILAVLEPSGDPSKGKVLPGGSAGSNHGMFYLNTYGGLAHKYYKGSYVDKTGFKGRYLCSQQHETKKGKIDDYTVREYGCRFEAIITNEMESKQADITQYIRNHSRPKLIELNRATVAALKTSTVWEDSDVAEILKDYFNATNERDFYTWKIGQALSNAAESVMKDYLDRYTHDHNKPSVIDNHSPDSMEGRRRVLMCDMYKTNFPSHWLVSSRDKDGTDAFVTGLRYADYVDDILDVTFSDVIKDLEKKLEEYKSIPASSDLESVPEFVNKYAQNRAMDSEAAKQILHYCTAVFGPVYDSLGVKPKDRITYGTRYVTKNGGENGYGRLARIRYALNYDEFKNQKITFREYMKRVSSMFYPVTSDTHITGQAITELKASLGLYLSNNSIGDAGDAGVLEAEYSYSENKFDKLVRDKKFTTEHELSMPKNDCLEWFDCNLCWNNKDPYSLYFDYCDQCGNTATPFADKVCIKWANPLSDNTNNDDGGISETYYADTKDGDDQSTHVAWRVPTRFVARNNDYVDVGKYYPVVKFDLEASNLAKGGKGSDVSVKFYKGDDHKYPYTYGKGNPPPEAITSQNAAKIIFQDLPAYGGVVSFRNAQKAQDTQFITDSSKLRDNDGRRFKIDIIKETDTGEKPITSMADISYKAPAKQTPQLRVTTQIWSKIYSLGNHGSVGNSSSSTETDLGSTCTFNIAPGGEVYKPNKSGDSPEYLNYMNSSLATSIKCTSSDGKIAFTKTVGGNGYNNGYVSDNIGGNGNKYRWSKALEKNEYVHKASITGQISTANWHPTSMWSRLFKTAMQYDGGYDLQKKYNVGAAGQGTSIVDRCTAPRGVYTHYMEYKLNYYTISPWNDLQERGRDFGSIEVEYGTNKGFIYMRKVTPLISAGGHLKKIEDTEETLRENGNMNGLNCYGLDDPEDDKIDSNTFYIYEDNPLVKRGLVDLSAGKGGGGAVVITW